MFIVIYIVPVYRFCWQVERKKMNKRDAKAHVHEWGRLAHCISKMWRNTHVVYLEIFPSSITSGIKDQRLVNLNFKELQCLFCSFDLNRNQTEAIREGFVKFISRNYSASSFCLSNYIWSQIYCSLYFSLKQKYISFGLRR